MRTRQQIVAHSAYQVDPIISYVRTADEESVSLGSDRPDWLYSLHWSLTGQTTPASTGEITIFTFGLLLGVAMDQ